MKQISQIQIPITMEAQTDTEILSYEDFEVESANANEGMLHKEDGIYCTECKNKGHVFSRKGGYMVMRDCQCMASRNSYRFIKDSGLNEMLKFRINNFETPEEWQKIVKQKADEYVTTNHNYWFVILGQSGTGKTHLCCAIANKLLFDGNEVIYAVWGDIAAKIKLYTTDDDDASWFRRYSTVSVLYIDDLFQGKYTDLDLSNAFQLLNYRYNNKLKTIISSELLFDSLMDVREAIAGRIKQMAGPYMTQFKKDVRKNYRLTGGNV